MKMKKYSPWQVYAFLFAAWLCLGSSQAWAADPADPAGQVASATGQVTAAGPDGDIRELKPESPVFSGDIINTGPNSRVRIVFSDNSVIALRPSTRFVIENYQHTGDPQQDQSAFALVRGGFRAVTGAIGQSNHDNYKIETPTATIGIRGTDHQGRFCAGDCFDLADIGIAAPPDGLYTATSVGRTLVGNQEFGAGEYGFTDPSGLTVKLPEPPPILVADPNLQDAVLTEEEKPAEEEAAPAGEPETQPGEGATEEGQPAEETAPETQSEPTGEAAPEAQPEPAGEPAPATQPEPAGETAPAAQPEPGGAPPADDLDIPAKPPTVRAIQC